MPSKSGTLGSCFVEVTDAIPQACVRRPGVPAGGSRGLRPGSHPKNDSFTTGGIAAFQDGFATGEIGAVRLTPTGPFPVQVTRVQFLFGGGVPGPDTITLRIWDDSAGTAAPGAPLFSEDYLVTASDTAFQEVDLSAAAIMVSGPFRVGITLHHEGVPSIARDNDGTPAGRNFILANGLGWVRDSTFFGIGGDWIIRAGVAADGPLFEDNFEAVNLLAWSSASTDGGDLNVAGGGRPGGHGLRPAVRS